jgi:NDP-sugar pyrophosphorylase family protein
MKKLLICPGKRPAMRPLGEKIPLVGIPMLGQTLIEYWLSHLAGNGIKQVALLAHHQPEVLQSIVQEGGRWGIELQLFPESRELTSGEALIKYDQWIESDPSHIITLDHFPGFPGSRLFDSYMTFFHTMSGWMPHCLMPDRVGIRELAPGVWAGVHTRIASSAQLKAPCWLGKAVYIGAKAIIGPGAIVEDGSVIEPETELVDSYVGPDTLVGQGGVLKDSIVWGSTLMNWKSGSATEIRDAFILCGLRRPQVSERRSWLERVTEIYAPDKGEDLFIKELLIKKESSS